MWGTSGVELLGIIDSQLAWNTDSKCRHRAPRRPRTSFLTDTKHKAFVNHLTKNDSPDKDSSCMDMPVSESEKLGVNILGHHFDGSLEGVPIKKRLLLSHSPSSSRVSPPNLSELADCAFESPGLCHINKKLESHCPSSNTNCYDADFSGISILAAAACDSPLSGCDIINSEASVSEDEDHDCHQKGLQNVESDKEDSSDAGVSDGKVDISGISAGSVISSAVEDGSYIVDLHVPDENMSCSNDIQFKGNDDASLRVITSKRSDKLHWDLNKEMDAWEFPYNEDAGLIDGPACADGFDDKADVDEVCLGLVGHRMEQVLPTTSHIPSQIVSASSDINAELDSSHLLKNCAGMGDTVNFSREVHCANEDSDNPCSSADNPCSIHVSAEETDASLKVFTGLTGVQLAFEQSVATQDVHGSTGDSHDHMLTVTPSKSSARRSLKDDSFESMSIEIPTCRNASSKNTSMCADDANNGEIEMTINDSFHGCQDMEDAESSDSSKERHGSSEQVDCNADTANVDCYDEKGAKSFNDPSSAALINKTGSNVDSYDEKGAKSFNDPSSAALINKTGSNGTCKSFSDAVVRMQDENVHKDYPNGSCNLGVTEIAAGGRIGMEQSEHNRDDDSQYEDGELQESVLHDWGIDGDADVEDEHVDYGSDEREQYIYDNALDSPACMISHDAEKIDGWIVELSEKCGFHPVSSQVSKESLETKSRSDGQCLDIEVAHEAPHCCDDNGVRYAELISKGDDHYKKSDRSASLRMSLPGSRLTCSFKGLCKECKNAEMPGMVKTEKTCKNVTDSKNILSQCERGRSSELPRSKDGTCHQTSSGDNVGDSDHTAKVDRGHIVYSRKSGTSHLREEARSKGHSGDEPPKQWISSQLERPRYYDSAGYGKAAPKNAVEAAAAKVESNGFAVAPDGTVVEPTQLIESTGWPSRRNTITAAEVTYRSFPRSLYSTGRDRILQFERDDALAFRALSKCRIPRKASPDSRLDDDEWSYRHGLRMLSSSRKEKYSMQISDERINSSLRGHRTTSQRNRSPSFQRDFSLPQHHGRSRSRSRTQSPNAWTSPRRNGRGRIRSDCGYRHCDRTPSDSRAADRGELGKVPYRHVNYADRLLDLGPSFRNFPNLPVRQFHERNDFDNLGRHGYRIYRRSSERSPPERSFSRSHRFDVLKHGRMDQDEYFREAHHGRHHEFTSAGKRARYDEDVDGRGHDNRSDMLISSSSREYEALGGMKHLRSDDSSGRRLESARPRPRTPPEFNKTDTSGGFIGGCDNQLGSPPRRSTDVKGRFRYARDMRRGAESKSAGLQECAKDVNPLRRR